LIFPDFFEKPSLVSPLASAPMPAIARSIFVLVLALALPARAQVAEAGPLTGTMPSVDAADQTPLTPAAALKEMLRKDDKQAALQFANDLLVKNPRDVQVRFMRAVLLADMNKPKQAEKALDEMTQDFPELPEPYNNLAVMHANEGDLTGAEMYLQKAIAAQPNYVTARENLGDLYVALAAATYDKAAQMAPANGAIQKKLAMARELTTKLRSAR
jgi:tetratricopeptide (TPR) repeat protein